MDWIQFVVFFTTVFGFIYSMKMDAKDDKQRAFDDRKDMIAIMRGFDQKFDNLNQKIDQKIDQLKDQISQENRDFHGRLCGLEEKYKQIKEKK